MLSLIVYFDYNSDALISLSFASDALIFDFCQDLSAFEEGTIEHF